MLQITRRTLAALAALVARGVRTFGGALDALRNVSVFACLPVLAAAAWRAGCRLAPAGRDCASPERVAPEGGGGCECGRSSTRV